ncbi:MAG: (d)CMP kinase [Candidatus Marinimicrobia bacterium]|jgi:cytidylate kinase|nr:(d)CMP kinase [Candidatus Neomarinimicrobiota bacterium]MBT3501898.1 (d)CMP kinase [Candidatus Neomarinimicrobiota bacterium]MBT3838576.1 (d)CMP kinase [Candidatus Neomarinimicrobiota bacterium]MBT3999810.1 (d)CMP kinase [Candidatus Neomarinimicrobiota bacterium]MBT4281865.1 (d)CMP kinase [Candidatus Neomarinimicrobiota bacterium]
MIIAIDGPSASGKSTTARCIAEILGFIHLDTGAMYRAVTLGLKNAGIATDDEKNVRLIIDKMEIQFDASNKILLNHVDVSSEIRTADISSRVSAVSALPFVREKLVKTQRLIAGENSCVLEGRDIGTVVFPNAEFKFFLIADIDVRARRRLIELEKMGESKTISDLIKDIVKRDELDSSRILSPLIQAKDAILIDTSNLTIKEQINKIINLINHNK